jgi:hypothetical protein
MAFQFTETEKELGLTEAEALERRDDRGGGAEYIIVLPPPAPGEEVVAIATGELYKQPSKAN